MFKKNITSFESYLKTRDDIREIRCDKCKSVIMSNEKKEFIKIDEINLKMKDRKKLKVVYFRCDLCGEVYIVLLKNEELIRAIQDIEVMKIRIAKFLHKSRAKLLKSESKQESEDILVQSKRKMLEFEGLMFKKKTRCLAIENKLKERYLQEVKNMLTIDM